VTILHVEDEAVIREVVCRALEAHGFAVASVDGVRAAKLVLGERRDVTGALLDIRLRDGNGLDLYHWITVHHPSLAMRVAFVTGSADTAAFGHVAALGCRLLRKPFEIAELLRLAEDWEGSVDAAPP